MVRLKYLKQTSIRALLSPISSNDALFSYSTIAASSATNGVLLNPIYSSSYSLPVKKLHAQDVVVTFQEWFKCRGNPFLDCILERERGRGFRRREKGRERWRDCIYYIHRDRERKLLVDDDGARKGERETELESAVYTNCLLLGLDLSIIDNGTPRVGKFHYSNPKLGEQLLYFISSTLRGPNEFCKVWPILEPNQSRDFRKVVQSIIISEHESQGELPRSNSRVSSLATCCGPRYSLVNLGLLACFYECYIQLYTGWGKINFIYL
ncbi:putative HAUS augmin-like complex subunit 6 [Helianthus anomalus]